MPYLGIFVLEFQKTTVIFEVNTPEFVKNEILTHTIDFGVRSVSSKGPRSAFSVDPGPSPGLLYNACHLFHLYTVVKKIYTYL